ncbi:hypothetical protein GCM10028803_05350 [Larkinella knui]|uniref:OmpA family protein n=1 Tax=Larkinella knui TaxID=2025310 RepID=A0A3P1CKE9_9BACT|nr:OmpA family protein [Larkinella knui]RRB13787.1 OmpA family protein [Larkinella knui]
MADNPKNEACKTYLEQTKLLVTLASAFILAPSIFFEKFNFFDGLTIYYELCFVLSVLFGYVVFGTITGTQHKGEFNVYNRGTMWFSRGQFFLFILGIVLLMFSFNKLKKTSPIHSKNHEKVRRLKSYKSNSVHVLNNIFFDPSNWKLRPESYFELSKLADTLRKYPMIHVSIQAHTDNLGSNKSNLALSEKRATSVVLYLISKGVPTYQLSSKGFGENVPIVANNTYEGRQLNRRIEFKILKSDL